MTITTTHHQDGVAAVDVEEGTITERGPETRIGYTRYDFLNGPHEGMSVTGTRVGHPVEVPLFPQRNARLDGRGEPVTDFTVQRYLWGRWGWRLGVEDGPEIRYDFHGLVWAPDHEAYEYGLKAIADGMNAVIGLCYFMQGGKR